MTVLMKQGRRVCNSRCHFAKRDVCKCICCGKFHGSNRPVRNINPPLLIKEDTKEKEEEKSFRNWLKRKTYHI